MKRLFFAVFTVAMIISSCTAQEPKTANTKAVEFAERYKMSTALRTRFYAIVNHLDSMSAPMESFESEYRTASEERKLQILAFADSIEKLMADYAAKQMIENQKNQIPAFLCEELGLAYEMDYTQLKEFCSPQTGYYNCPEMEKPKKILAGMEKRAPGKMFTDFQGKDLASNTAKLSDFIGKGNYVLIDFWASWCGPCRAEMPNVKAAYDRFHPQGFQIVGISLDNNQDAWKNAVKALGLPWNHISDLKGWKSAAAQAYGIMSIPASILVDPDGKIVCEGLRGEKLQQKLEEIYSK